MKNAVSIYCNHNFYRATTVRVIPTCQLWVTAEPAPSPHLDCFLTRRVRLVVQKTGSAHGEVRRGACWRRLRQQRLKRNWGVLLWRRCSQASLHFLVFYVSWQLAVAAVLLRSVKNFTTQTNTQHGSVAAICVIFAFFKAGHSKCSQEKN